jgi:nucleotide-binding universal stress UspA family protein
MRLKTIVVFTDGSDAATKAALAGVAVLQPADKVVVAIVVGYEDESALAGMGTGLDGTTLMPGDFSRLDQVREETGQAIAARTAALLAHANTEIEVLRGDPGPTLSHFAGEVSASAIVMGSRGHNRIKRALLGSVSDYVVRNAPCPVVITGPDD